jgi:SnoaL-like domain
MDDAVSRYCAASEAGDVDGIMATLAPDVELVSPISGKMVFRGSGDVELLLRGVYGSLKGLSWTDTLGDGERRVIVGEARLLGVRLTDAMVLDLAADGRISRVGPHIRPWLALTLFALVLGPKIGVRPGAVWRALRG